MHYRLLGNSGLRVSELCLGTMTFGEDWGWGASKHEAKRIFDAFLAAGGNFIDTANHYTNGTSERFLGEFIQSERDHVVVATKYTLVMEQGKVNSAGNQRKNLVQSIHGSLKRLHTDFIDVLWVHAWDFMTPVAEVMRALDDVIRAGHVLYVGVSDTPAWVVAQANMLADLRGWSPFVGLQMPYSLIQRTVERELLPMAHALGLCVLAWSPLGMGVLTGKYNRSASPSETPRFGTAEDAGKNEFNSQFVNERSLQIAAEVVAIAKQIGRSPSQVALAWLRQQPGIIIPIVGARTLSQVEDNLRCLEVTLDSAQLQRLDDLSRIALGFPHNFLHSASVREVVYGGCYDKIVNHHARG
jgi:aryl-alcohol dehydrogenase-like predicted oxidoreductase